MAPAGLPGIRYGSSDSIHLPSRSAPRPRGGPSTHRRCLRETGLDVPERRVARPSGKSCRGDGEADGMAWPPGGVSWRVCPTEKSANSCWSTMSADAVIRRGTPADAIAAAEVWLRSRKAAVPAIPHPRHTDDEVRHYFQTVVVMQRELWLAVDDINADVTGLLALSGAEVDQLYVDPDSLGAWDRLATHRAREATATGRSLAMGLPDQHRGAPLLRASRLRCGRRNRRIGE
jgi:hypothetical protein